MNRKLTKVVVALITLALGVWVASLGYLMRERDHSIEIPQQQLLPSLSSCVEEQTPDEFSTFWLEFRSAVQREDKRKLFSLTRKCSFVWEPFSGRLTLVKPLETDSRYVPFQLGTPFEVRPTLLANWGNDLRFGTYDNFLANYEMIFSEKIRLHFLRSKPGPSTECENAISWREEVLSHLCFDRAAATGFKFSGLKFEP